MCWPGTGRAWPAGERARRAHDVFLQRPGTHRNAAWEADHVEVSVEVEAGGRLVKPWVTWFVDAGTSAVCGAAVTPGAPSRESILAALRAAITLEAPYGPPGGLPEHVRIDRGKDFLSKTVASVLAGVAVRVGPLPGYTPGVHRSGYGPGPHSSRTACRVAVRPLCKARTGRRSHDGSSWISQAERWLGFLTDQMIRRGPARACRPWKKMSAPGSRTGTRTPGRSCGQRPPRRSSIP
jgi:hypothetical protein